jgi:hypothetical protein
MRRSASPNAPCSAASAHHDDDEARPPGEIGDRDRDRTRAADNHLRPWQYRLDEDVHRALARAHIVGETHALLLLARFHAAVGEHVGRLHRDEPRALAHLAGYLRVASLLFEALAGRIEADPKRHCRFVIKIHRTAG